MPKKLLDRNKAIVQLLKCGWTKYAVANLFGKYGWGKCSVYLVMRRDWEKYNIPTQAELEQIEQEYKLNIKQKNAI